MKEKLLEIWRRDEIDYLIDFALIAVLLFGGLQTWDARQTLQGEGCQVYWERHNPGVNVSSSTFMNRTEYREWKERKVEGLGKFEKQRSSNYG